MLHSDAKRNAVVIGAIDGSMQLRLEDSAGCGSCHRSCQTALLPATTDTSRIISLRRAAGSVVPGTTASVQLGLSSGSLGVLAAGCYLTQSVLMVLGAFLAIWLTGGGDGSALLGAILGLLLGCLGLWLYDSRGGGQRWVERVSIRALAKGPSQHLSSN
jgi:positive regulator of sigma E activity